VNTLGLRPSTVSNLQIFGEMVVELMSDLEVVLEDDLIVELEPNEYEVVLEDDLQVVLC